MTVKQLRDQLRNMPENMEVYLCAKEKDFDFVPVELIEVKTINMKEDPDGKTLAKLPAVVLSDEI